MKKIRFVVTLVLALLLGLLVGARLFMPWNEITELAFLKASSRTPDGVTLDSKSYFVQGLIPSLGIRGIELKTFMGSVSVDSLKTTPLLTASLMSLSPTALVEIDGAMTNVGGKDSSFRGSLVVSIKPGRVSIEKLNLTGDLSTKGGLDISLETSKIIRADMTLECPKELEGALSAASAMMPLERGTDGVWTLKREEAE